MGSVAGGLLVLVEFFDEEIVEDREVEQPAFVLGQFFVADAAPVDEQQGFIEGSHDVIDLGLGGVLPFADLGALSVDALLLFAHDLHRHPTLVIKLQQALLLAFELSQPPSVALGLDAGDAALGIHRLLDGLPDEFSLPVGQPVFLMDGFQVLLDLAQAEVAGAARPFSTDSAEAGVVLVDAALFAAVAAVAVAVAAAAGKLPGQVMLMYAAATAASVLGRQDGLDPFEAVAVDQRLMPPLHGDAVSRDHTRVVVAGQQAVDAGASERPGWPCQGGPGGQAGGFEDLGDGADRVVAGEGQIEGHLHQGARTGSTAIAVIFRPSISSAVLR